MNSKAQKQIFVLLGAFALSMLIAPLYGVVEMEEYANQFFFGLNWINVMTQVLFVWFMVDALRGSEGENKPWVTVVMAIIGAQALYLLSLVMAEDTQHTMDIAVDILARLVAILTGWAVFSSRGLMVKSLVAVAGVVIGLLIGMI